MTDFRVLEYDKIDSTNEEAKRLVREAARRPFDTVITAKHQTAGKGRRGKRFFSPGGDSIYASFILKPPKEPAEQLITAFAAVAVCEAIEQATDYRPRIKWLNDIYVGGKKVCGILAEGISGAAILGIGVNINIIEENFSDELRDIAGSLHMSREKRDRLFGDLIGRVFCYAAAEAGSSEAEALTKEYCRREGSDRLTRGVS